MTLTAPPPPTVAESCVATFPLKLVRAKRPLEPAAWAANGRQSPRCSPFFTEGISFSDASPTSYDSREGVSLVSSCRATASLKVISLRFERSREGLRTTRVRLTLVVI